MGIYDRDYYRRETAGSPWLTGAAPVTLALVLANIAVFLAQTISLGGWDGRVVTDALSLTPAQLFEQGQVWRLLTAAFCHAGIWHILWNMLMLWWFGRELEMIYGPRNFLIFYLTAAVVASGAWALASWGQHAAMVGASGAIAAVIVVYTIYYPRQRIYIYGIVPVEMRWFVICWLGVDAFMLVQQGGYSPVAHVAHLGGAAFGLIYKLADLRASRLFVGRWHRLRVHTVEREPEPSVVGLDEDLDHKMDQILEKIAREGQSSLTQPERELLQRASRVLRNRRR